MSAFFKTAALLVLSAAIAAPTALSAQTAGPAVPPKPGARAAAPKPAQPAPLARAAPLAPVQPTVPARTNWWNSASEQALSRRPADAQRLQTQGGQAQAPQARGSQQAQAPQAGARKSRRYQRRAIARRSAAARRELARQEQAAGVLRVATGATESASRRPGDEVAGAIGAAKTVKSDGRRALARGAADLAVAPSLDGSIGRDGERVAKLFDAVVLVVGRKDVASTDDLAGKPVEIGDSYSDAAAARDALKVMGVEVTEQRSSVKQAIDNVASGKCAGAVIVAVKGSTEVGDALATNADLRLVPVGPGVAADRSTKLTKDTMPALGEGEEVRALPAEISLFARRGKGDDEATIEAVRGLYGQIPQLLASGAGPWWRSVPLAAEASAGAQGWTPTAPDLESKDRGGLAEGLERVGLERAIEAKAAAEQPTGRSLWVVKP